MASFSDRPTRSIRARKVTPLQFSGAVIAFILVAVLTGVLAAGLFVPAVGALGVAAKTVPATFDDLPADFEIVSPSEESRMTNNRGEIFARFFSARRITVPSEKISQTMKNAIVAIEDRRFYEHHGVDPEGIVAAVIGGLRDGKMRGASTITQQYVKNIQIERGIQEGNEDLIDEAEEQTVERKLREARYAIALETRFSKDEILSRYLNLSPFGPNLYGVETAAQTYFSIPASDLTVGQAAMLAGLVQAPSEYDPLENPEAAQTRRNTVLGEMLNHDYITEAEYDEAMAVDVVDMLKPNVRVQGCGQAGTDAYFCNYVLSEFLADEAFGETVAERRHLLQNGGLTLRTTLDVPIQAAARQAAIDRVPVHDESKLDTAIVSVVPTNGYIVAMAQNSDYGLDSEQHQTEINFNVHTAQGGGQGFQPGSTFKVFTLVEWFNEGKGAYDVVGSNNTSYPQGSFRCGNEIAPVSAPQVFDLANKQGPTDVLRATKMSINQAFVSMASKVDFCQIFERAKALGVTTEDGELLPHDSVSSIIGGDGDVAPIQMASALGAIGNNGIRCKPMALLEVADRDGKVIKSFEPDCSEALSAKVAQQTTTILKWTAASYTAGDLDGRQFAAKTGTTDNYSNTWVVGFTPQLATAAWVGTHSDSSREIGDMWIDGEYYSQIFGGDFVLPMWTQFMRDAHEGWVWETIPEVFVGNKPKPKPSATPKATKTTKPPTQVKATKPPKTPQPPPPTTPPPPPPTTPPPPPPPPTTPPPPPPPTTPPPTENPDD